MWLSRFIFPVENPLTDQVADDGTDITGQFHMTDLETRRKRRYGSTYLVCDYMKKTLDTTHVKNGEPLILLPPNDYLRKIGNSFTLAEPAEIYYHCGLKTVWTNNPNVDKVNWAFVVDGKDKVAFVPITSKEQLQQILNLYKDYKPSL